MKKLLLLLISGILLSSCADSKFVNGKKCEPYGWANYQSVKEDDVIYKANIGNIVWSVILSETIIVPIWLTGWQLYEPVKGKPNTVPNEQI